MSLGSVAERFLFVFNFPPNLIIPFLSTTHPPMVFRNRLSSDTLQKYL